VLKLTITIVDGQTQNTNGKVFQNARCNWIKCTCTYSHNLAPLLHILPHGVDDVTAHVLPSSAFLPHPDQTHPVREKQNADSRQPDKPRACVRICVTRRSARQNTHREETSGLNRQHLCDVGYHRNHFFQTEAKIENIFCDIITFENNCFIL